MLVSLLVAATFHGVVFGGAVLITPPERVRPSPAVTKSDDVDVDVVPARPDPIAEQPPAPATPDALPSSPVRTTPRFTVARSTSSTPRDLGRAEHSSEATPSVVPELAASSGSAFSAPEPTASPGPIAAGPSLAPAESGQASAGSARGPATPSLTPPLGKVVSAVPRYRSNPPPDYPISSRRRGEEGTVLLNVVVTTDGRPNTVSVAHSSGYPLLDRAAVAAVREWTFEPARVGGVPISSQVVVPVRFSLSE
jgi:periplasmic protein TonB